MMTERKGAVMTRQALLDLAARCEREALEILCSVIGDNLAPNWRAQSAIEAAGKLSAAAALRTLAQENEHDGHS